MRLLALAWALVVAASLLHASAAAGPLPAASTRGALAVAQERLDAARDLATTVAERLSAARSEQSQLEAEIAEAEVEIPALRARADELQLIVRERAARLYVRSATPRLDAVVNTDNVVNAARGGAPHGSDRRPRPSTGDRAARHRPAARGTPGAVARAARLTSNS